MSYQRPIFLDGLYGKANAEVMNGFVQTSSIVDQYMDAIQWAERESRRNEFEIRYFLGSIKSATAMTGQPYRWTYSGNPCIITSTYDVVDNNDGRDIFTTAINLAEIFNNSGWVDGDTTTGASFGPVGSTYNTTWQTTNLRAVCIVATWINKDGAPVYFFDRKNPVTCTG